MIAPLLLQAAPPADVVRLFLDLPAWLVFGFVFVFGTICGSFLNVCVYRLPQHPHGHFWPALKGLWSPPSSCPRCRSLIPWRDNIPVLGWLLLRGRCRKCRMSISPQYPLVELFNGLLFVLVYWLEVPQGRFVALSESCLYSALGPQAVPGLGGWSAEAWIHVRFLYHLVLIEALLAASLIDLRLMIIPDTVTLPAMAVGVVGAVLVGRLQIVPVWFQEPRLAREFSYVGPDWLQWLVSDGPAIPAWIMRHPHWHGLAASLAGLAVGAGVVWLVRVVGAWGLRREAMGDGDVVLMGMVGSFIGWQPVLVAFFIAPLLVFALLLIRGVWRRLPWAARGGARWRDEIPYGPYLALGTLLTLLLWSRIGPWAESRIFGLGPLLLPIGVVGVVTFALLLLAMRGIKRLLGIPDGWESAPGAWTAADQHQYLAGEQVDRFTNRWRCPDDWPGTAASRGTLFHERWRSR